MEEAAAAGAVAGAPVGPVGRRVRPWKRLRRTARRGAPGGGGGTAAAAAVREILSAIFARKWGRGGGTGTTTTTGGVPAMFFFLPSFCFSFPSWGAFARLLVEIDVVVVFVF